MRSIGEALREVEKQQLSEELLGVLAAFAQAQRDQLDALRLPALTVDADVSASRRQFSWFLHAANDERSFGYPLLAWFEGLWTIPTAQHQTEPARLQLRAVGRGQGWKFHGFLDEHPLSGSMLDMPQGSRLYARGSSCGTLELGVCEQQCCGVLSCGTKRKPLTGFRMKMAAQIGFNASLDPSARFGLQRNLRFVPGRSLRASMKGIGRGAWAVECWVVAEKVRKGSAVIVRARGLALELDCSAGEPVLKVLRESQELARMPFAVGARIQVRLAVVKQEVEVQLNHQKMAQGVLQESGFADDTVELGGEGFAGFIGELKLLDAAFDAKEVWSVRACFYVSATSIYGAGQYS